MCLNVSQPTRSSALIDGYEADSRYAAYKNDRQQPLHSGRLGNYVRHYLRSLHSAIE